MGLTENEVLGLTSVAPHFLQRVISAARVAGNYKFMKRRSRPKLSRDSVTLLSFTIHRLYGTSAFTSTRFSGALLLLLSI
jgi:hypothetical protein